MRKFLMPFLLLSSICFASFEGDPVKVVNGGTQTTSATAYGIVAGGTTSTAPFQNIGTGATGQILLSNGSAALATWQNFSTSGALAPTVQKFLSGSGTYTTPAGVVYITVEMVGGGGGGGGSFILGGGTAGGTGGTGGNTTFGTSLLAANGGSGGVSGGASGAGGSASLGSGPIGVALTGGQGGPTLYAGTSTFYLGSSGGASPFGGSGSGGYGGSGAAGTTNTGGGGGGGGAPGNGTSGSGGGSGGYVKAIIANPSATYSYVVGTAGTAGTAGTSGYSGGAAGSGLIVVTEYYSLGASSVTAMYYGSTTAVSSTLSTIVYTTADHDSLNMCSSGVCTIPANDGGTFTICAYLSTAGTVALNSLLDIQIQKNGTLLPGGEVKLYAGGAMTDLNNGLCDSSIKLNAADTIQIQASSTATLPTITSSNSQNYFSITRTGN